MNKRLSLYLIFIFLMVSGCVTAPYINNELLNTNQKRLGIYNRNPSQFFQYDGKFEDTAVAIDIIKDHLMSDEWDVIDIGQGQKSLSQLFAEAKSKNLPYIMCIYFSFTNASGIGSGAVIRAVMYNVADKQKVFSSRGESKNAVILSSNTSSVAGYYPGSYQTTTSISYMKYDINWKTICDRAVSQLLEKFPRLEK